MSKNRNKSRVVDTQLLPWHFVFQSTLSAGVAAFPLLPSASISPRALTEADAWAHFRVRSFAFRIHPSTASGIAAGYVGGRQDVNPSTIATISELIPSCFHASQTTVPSEWVRVPKSDLAGPLPWYKTIAGTADSTEEAPGVVCLAGGTTDPYAIEFRGVFEFKTAVAAANTPAQVALRERVRIERRLAEDLAMRESLLKILAVVPTQGNRP